MEIEFKDKLKKYKGTAGWHYVNTPGKYTKDIKMFQLPGAGFGSVKVNAKIGYTKWDTSVFYDSEDKVYILFIKKSVREAEGLTVGDNISCSIKIIDR